MAIIYSTFKMRSSRNRHRNWLFNARVWPGYTVEFQPISEDNTVNAYHSRIVIVVYISAVDNNPVESKPGVDSRYFRRSYYFAKQRLCNRKPTPQAVRLNVPSIWRNT